MKFSKEYKFYKIVIQQVIREQEQLPSLPSITWKIRNVIKSDSITNDKLAGIIRKDPSLSALLMKSAASPLYRQEQPPSTLEGVITMLGLTAVDNLVMAHSVKSLFVMRSPVLKKLFHHTWQRMLLNAGISRFLATKTGYHPADQAMIASLLSEIGSLAILSAFKDQQEVPSETVYHQLCREYGKSLGVILLNKWKLEPCYTDIIKAYGCWHKPSAEGIQLVDVVNMALYCMIQLVKPDNNLPDIHTVHAYQKLPAPFNVIDEHSGQLVMIRHHLKEIKQLSFSLR